MAGEDPGVAVVPVGAVEALVGGVVAAAGAVREGGVALVGEEEAGLLPVADEEALDSVVAVVDGVVVLEEDGVEVVADSKREMKDHRQKLLKRGM